MPGMDNPESANLAAQMQEAMHSMAANPAQQLAVQSQQAQQFPVPLPYMLHSGSLMQMSPSNHQDHNPDGAPADPSGLAPEGSEGVQDESTVASSNANLLKLFAAACQQKGIVTRTQRAEMVSFVQQMYMDRMSH